MGGRSGRGGFGLANPARVAAAERILQLSSAIEPRFDSITESIRQTLGSTFAAITLLDETDIYWLERDPDGVTVWDHAGPARFSFSRHVVEHGAPFSIDDAELEAPGEGAKGDGDGDDRRSYLGVPLWSPDGFAVGTVCAANIGPRAWLDSDGEFLESLAEAATDVIRLTEAAVETARGEELLTAVLDNANIFFALLDDDLRFRMLNDALADDSGCSAQEFIGRRWDEMMPLIAQPLTDMLENVLDTGESFANAHVIGPSRSRYGPRRVFDVSCSLLDRDERLLALFATELTEQVAARSRAALTSSLQRAFSQASDGADVERLVDELIASFFHADEVTLSPGGPEVFGLHEQAATALTPEVAHDSSAPLLIEPSGRVTDRIGDAPIVSAIIPCVSSDRRDIATITLRWTHGLDPQEVSLPELRTVGDLVGGVIERHRLLGQQAQLISELRDALVTPPPTRPHVRVAVQYRPTGATGLGGDWFDVVPLSDTSTALVIGDVAGHGPVATAAMSQIGSTIADLLLLGVDLTHLFDRVEYLMTARSVETMATTQVVVIDAATHTLSVASAGHLPALLLPPSGAVQTIGRASRPPIGTFDAPTNVEQIEYTVGTRLLMYTDGLIERRGQDLDVEVCNLARRFAGHADTSIGAMTELLMPRRLPNDDDVLLLGAELHD